MKHLYFLIFCFLFACGEKPKEVKDTYPDGSLRFKYYKVNEKIEGDFFEFYNTGELMGKKYFKNGLEQGNAKLFYQNGTIKGSSNFKDGKLHGIDSIFYPSGNVRFVSTFQNGKKHGPFKRFNETSQQLEFEAIYENDSLLSVKNSLQDSLIAQ